MKVNNITIRKYNDTDENIIVIKPKWLSIYFDYNYDTYGEMFLIIDKFGIDKIKITDAKCHQIDSERILFSAYLGECINGYHAGYKVDVFCNFTGQ